MTEEELIELVNQKTPDELSLEEIDQIREGISSSHMLREALAGQLKVEQGLNESMGKIEVSVEKIILAAGAAGAGALLATPAAPMAPVLLNWGVGSAIVAVLSSVMVLAIVAPPPPAAKPDPKVVVEPPKKVDEDLPAPSQGDPTPVDTSKNPNDPSKDDPKTEARKNPGKTGTQVASNDPNPAQVLTSEAAAAAKVAAALKAAQDAWDEQAPKRPFAEMANEDFASYGTDFGSEPSGGRKAEQRLLDYFSPFPGKTGRVDKFVDGNRTWAFMDGWLKFQPVWRKNGVLKLSLFGEQNVKLHFWDGREGVTLAYYNQQNETWAAYGTTRKGSESQPANYVLWDHDDDRFRRTARGTFEIRQQDGHLILSRGEVLLMSVPFKRAPQEVYFEGHAKVRGISFFHGVPYPEEPENPLPLVWRSAAPAKMEFAKDLPKGAQVKLNDDGSVELSSSKTQQMAWVGWNLPESGLTELVFQLEDAKPGSGVYLGDNRGKPQLRVGVVRENNSKGYVLNWLWPNEPRVEGTMDLGRIVPWINSTPGAKPPYSTQWIRLVAGHGTARFWMSGDGVHWGRAIEPFRTGDIRGAYPTAGIYCQPGEGNHSVKLRLMEIRRLDAIASLAPLELRGKAPFLGLFNTPAEWIREVLASCPPGVEPRDWQRACAVRTLAGGATPLVAKAVLQGLLQEGMRAKIPAARRLQMLDEAMLLVDAWEQPEAVKAAKLYEQLGQILAEEGDPHPFLPVARALVETPIFSWGDFPTMPESLVRAEILPAVYSGRATDVYDVCSRARAWSYFKPHHGSPQGREELLALCAWAAPWARANWNDKNRELPPEETVPQGQSPVQFRHPLMEQFSKEGYNVLKEFEGALGGDSYQDACQIITSSSTVGALGLLPDAKDGNLLVSLPNAVALAMRESPALKRTMQDQFGKVGMLRVKQAMAEGSTLDVQAATVQFYGTDAAAEAHLWLGDRALASGDFPHAIGHYQQLLTAGIGIGGRQAQIAARVRLAGALLGRDVGQPATESIDLGGSSLSPSDFEALVTDLRNSRAVPGSTATAVAGESSARGQGQAPQPARFETRPWARFAPSQGEGGAAPPRSSDFLGPLVATLVAGDKLIVTNRFEVAVYDLGNAQMRWSRRIGGAGKVNDYPVAMAPVIVGDRLLLRWITKTGPELVALDLKSGNTIWTAKTGAVLCDPLVVQDQVHVIASGDLVNRVVQVHFVSIDLRNGQVVSQSPLAQIRGEHWNRQIPCQAVLVDDRIIATLGGTVLSVDLLGRPQWLRRQTVIPQAQDYRWTEQTQDPPVISRGQVFATQPGVREITCLDLETGRLRWERAMPQLARLTGLVDGKLIVRTVSGIEALNAKDGTTVWQRAEPDLLVAHLLPAARPEGKSDSKMGRDIVIACSEAADYEGQSRVRLAWIDPATGQEKARRPLADLTHKNPLFGPLVAHDNRLFGFFRKSGENHHDIVELAADGELPRLTQPESVAELPPTWRGDLKPPVLDAASDLFPGWQLLEGQDDKTAGYRKDWQGARDVFVCAGTPNRGVMLARQVTIPMGSKARLALKVGHDTADKWSVDVRVGTTVLATQKLEVESSQNGWKEWQVDLSPYAGKTVWVVVEQRGVQTPRVLSYWKQLEIVN